MSSDDLRELYQSIIVDHNKNSRNYGTLPLPAKKAEGVNALCGDRVQVYVRVTDGFLSAIKFEAAACAICRASASLMTEALSGKAVSDLRNQRQIVERLLSGRASDKLSANKELSALSGIHQFPSRINCALLPWQTLEDALSEEG